MDKTTLEWLNALPAPEAVEVFRGCCGASAWCNPMATARPYDSSSALCAEAEKTFDTLDDNAWLEAFASHPRIGDFESLKMKFVGNREWSAGEQSGAAGADESTLRKLAAGNDAYEARFGYLFIVCATGKSAAEMLAILESRQGNAPHDELRIAAEEQRKITRLRLAKLGPPTKA